MAAGCVIIYAWKVAQIIWILKDFKNLQFSTCMHRIYIYKAAERTVHLDKKITLK